MGGGILKKNKSLMFGNKFLRTYTYPGTRWLFENVSGDAVWSGFSIGGYTLTSLGNRKWQAVKNDTAGHSIEMSRNTNLLAVLEAPDTHRWLSGDSGVQSAFVGCTSLKSVCYFDTSEETVFNLMFFGCTSLKSVPAFDMSNALYMDQMFMRCTSLETIPLFNIPNVTTMEETFSGCTSLKYIPAINANSVTVMLGMLDNCAVLTDIDMYNIGANLDVSTTGLLHDGLVKLIGNLKTVSDKTLTLGKTKLALLSDTEKAIATNKGWTLA